MEGGIKEGKWRQSIPSGRGYSRKRGKVRVGKVGGAILQKSTTRKKRGGVKRKVVDWLKKKGNRGKYL